MNRIFRKRYVVPAALVVAGAVTVGVAFGTPFTNAATITISDPMGSNPVAASPYPSPIAVSGLVGQISDVNVTFNDFTHSAPDDVDALVTSPGGGKVIVMSDAGDTNPVNSAIDLTFDDAAASSLTDTGTLTSGTFKPSNYGSSGADDPFCTGEPDPDAFVSTAPAGPYSSTLAAFNTQSPNGTWNLYIVDDCDGASGSIAGGWTVDITTNPTGVAVAGLTSRAVKAGVSVRWTTSSETAIAGFNVYRANAKLNKRLIGARHSGLARGGAYSVVDRAARKGGVYTYRLQVVGLDGKKSWFGATSIHVAS